MQETKSVIPATTKERLLPLALFTTMTLVTLLLLVNYPKYHTTGNELLSNPDFSENFSGWEKHGKSDAFSVENGAAKLSQQSKKDNSRLTQRIGGEFAEVYLISTELGSNNIGAGTEDWQNGALAFIQEDENNKRISSEVIVGIKGTQGIAEHQKFVEVLDTTKNLAIRARMLNATGDLLIQSISLKEAVKQPGYPTLRTILIVSWVAMGLLLVVLHLRRFGLTTPFIVLCGIAGLAFIGTLMPKHFTVELSATISNLMPEQFSLGLKQVLEFFFPGYIGHSHQEISKFGHWVAFFSLSAMATMFLRKTPLYYIVLTLLVLAAATETLQFLTSARTPHINDFLIDAAGVVVGLIVALPVRWMTRNKA